MAIIYFDNNLNDGAGSLRNAIDGATDGDIIKPNPSKFSSLTPCIIKISTSLVGKASSKITIDGTETPITIDGQNLSIRLVYLNSVGGELVFKNITFIGGSASSYGVVNVIVGVGLTVENCRFHANICTSTGGVLSSYNGKKITVINCLFSGNSANGGVVRIAYAGDNYNIVGCTLTGNNGYDVVITRPTAKIAFKNCLIETVNNVGEHPDAPETFDKTTVHFVNAPTADISDYVNWNLHLMADSYYKSGATWSTGDKDLDGNDRALNGSFGCFEFVQSDYITTVFGADLRDIALKSIGVYIPWEQAKNYF